MKVGDKVVHKGTRAVRIIVALYPDIAGGVRLNREVEGFVSWNARDLKLWTPHKRKKP